ncbi:MAG: methyltransferase domain-containing protein [Dehalococcoidia bacterium]
MGLIRKSVERRSTERMPDLEFRLMDWGYTAIDFFYPYVRKRAGKFGIGEGMTVVDYGCGPGRYTVRFAAIVGERGKVYAVDIHELAIAAVNRRIRKQGFRNVEPILAEGYRSQIPDEAADIVCAIDMFFIIKDPSEFLGELKRITRNDGMLVIDDGHQPRDVTRQKVLDSGYWTIFEESKDHLKCRPLSSTA